MASLYYTAERENNIRNKHFENKDKINKAFSSPDQTVQIYQTDDWSTLESKTAQKRAFTLYEKLSSLSNLEKNIVVLLPRITQVIQK